MRLNLLAGACAASMLLALTPTVQAADIDVAPEPMGWSWYVSVFGGWSLPKDENLFAETSAPSSPVTVDADIELDNGFMAGVAVGAHFNEWARAELELSGHWHDAEGTYEVNGGSGSDLSGDENALFALANLWLDLPVGDVIRPYVGGGVGFASIDVIGLKDVNVPNLGVAFAKDNTETNFAWALYAGLAYDVTPSVTIDLSYRYTDLGDAKSGIRTAYDESGTAGGIEIEDITSHDLMLGVRWRLGSQPAPMPVAFK